MSVAQRFTFDDRKLSDELRAVRERGGHLGPAFDQIGMDMIAVSERAFELGRSPDGKAWKPSWRARTEGGSTLVEHGLLRDSLTYVIDVGGEAVEIGTNRIYARIHQLGGKVVAKGKALRFRLGKETVFRKSVTLPPRPFIGAAATDIARWADILRDHVAGLGPAEGGA